MDELSLVSESKYKLPFTQGCFVPCLIEINPVVLEKIFKNWPSGYEEWFLNIVNAFSLLPYNLPMAKSMAINLKKKMNSHHPRLLYAKFGSGSGEEDKNVESLQTDDRQTRGYQNSSLELSVQMS